MLFTLCVFLLALPRQANVVVVQADRDNTLIEDPAGALSNGSGPAFFVGRTNQPQNSIRRGVLRFELEGVLPPGAVVEKVRLVLHASAVNGPNDVRLHRLLQDWGEGSSSSGGGQGAPAAPGDATWLHTFFDQEFWAVSGAASRLSRASAQATVMGAGFVVWGSPALGRDVAAWLEDPRRNFGWLLVGNELASQTVTRFDSRESFDPGARPMLVIRFRGPPGR